MEGWIKFMANDKSLISFAIMSVEYGQNNKDYFDMLIPFILVVLKNNYTSNKQAISVKKVNEYLNQDFGFGLQHNVLEALLRRITNKKYGYLLTQNNNFFLTDKEINIGDFSIRKVEARQHQDDVFSSFKAYLDNIQNFNYDEEEMKKKLIIYLNRYGFSVLSEQEIELILEDKNDIYTHYIGKFISERRNTTPIIFE